MKEKSPSVRKDMQIAYVLERLKMADNKAQIIKGLREEFNLRRDRALQVYSDALDIVKRTVLQKSVEYKGILIERLEAQYKDTYQIEDINKRLQRQRELIETMAKIIGITRSGSQTINIFEHFPDAEDKVVKIK